MPTDPDTNNIDQQAFEFVVGTLRGGARNEFARRIKEDPQLARAINFWEEHLMDLPDPTPVPLAADSWHKIAAQLNEQSQTPREDINLQPLARLARQIKVWLMPSLVASLCTLLVVFTVFKYTGEAGSEYVAVLNDAQGRTTLTAITEGESANMRIQWQPVSLAADKHLQLWAISKRDGQARSLAVFPAAQGNEITLDTPQLRLVKDAESLLLTQEDIGGSAIDEPSESVVAKGICVRFAAR